MRFCSFLLYHQFFLIRIRFPHIWKFTPIWDLLTFRIVRYFDLYLAEVAELADAQDSKSCDRFGRAGSSPALGTQRTVRVIMFACGTKSPTVLDEIVSKTKPVFFRKKFHEVAFYRFGSFSVT